MFYLNKYYLLYIVKDPHTIEIDRWHKAAGDSTLRVDYPLNESSIVFDLGGYKGNWTHEISRRYGCHIFVFEPVAQFYRGIRIRFAGNDKIHVFAYGLSDKTESKVLYLHEDGSSVYRPAKVSEEIRVVDICEFLEEQQIESIDLIKINVEGEEFRLLRRMLDAGFVSRCRDIQVQFHRFFPGAEHLRNELRSRMEMTHFPTYDYPFVWENWRRKSQGNSRGRADASIVS